MTSGRSIVAGGTEEDQRWAKQLTQKHGSPLLVLDPAVLRRQFTALTQALPNVQLYYAVKANPHPDVIRAIDALSGGFDVASSGETDLLLQLRVFGRRTIHTHPIKKDDEIRTALRYGVTTFVVDNPYELNKLVPYRSRVGVLLRLSFRNPTAIVDLSRKFGASIDDASTMITMAKQLGIHIKGVSFHAGSQCEDASKHVEAIQQCHQFMLAMNDHQDVPLNVMDIGGGFPADYAQQGLDIGAFCEPIRTALAALPNEWDLLAEPGRFLVAPAVTSITTVIGKSIRDGVRWYYLDDGVYGSYSGQIYDHAEYPLQVFETGQVFPSVLAGPTCDSIDCIADEILLPELQPGSLVLGHEMGAYTAATQTRFNSLPNAKFITLDRAQCATSP